MKIQLALLAISTACLSVDSPENAGFIPIPEGQQAPGAPLIGVARTPATGVVFPLPGDISDMEELILPPAMLTPSSTPVSTPAPGATPGQTPSPYIMSGGSNTPAPGETVAPSPILFMLRQQAQDQQ